MNFGFGYSFEEFKNRQILVVANEGIDKFIRSIKDMEGSVSFVEQLNDVKKQIEDLKEKAGVKIEEVRTVIKAIKFIVDNMGAITEFASVLIIFAPVFEVLFNVLN